MKLISSIKFVKSNLDINSNREELIGLYYKYFILLNGYDRMDAFLKVTNTTIDNFIDKDIYKFATNYKKAVDFVNNLSNKYDYLFVRQSNKLVGLLRFKETKSYIRIYEFTCDDKLYNKVLKYLDKYCKEKNYKKIYLEIPINDIKLLIRSNKMGYIEDNNDLHDEKKYVVNKEIL